MIVVTGATGHVGGLVAEELERRGVEFRLVVRDVGRAPQLRRADVRLADYGDTAALEQALEPGDRVFMVSVHEGYERRVELHRSFVEVAARREVGRVVYLSFIGAGPDASFLHARSHGATEAMLEESGVPFTAVRNGMYADGIASWFDSEGRITGPGADGRISFSARLELAQAIAILLADPTLDRPLVTITGPESVTLGELAAIASEVTGDAYRYEPLDRADWLRQRRALGRPEWAIEAGLSYYDGVRQGEADVVTDDYRELTGRSPVPIADVIRQRSSEMPLSRRAADGS